MDFSIAATCLTLGIVMEAVSYALKLWSFRDNQLLFLHERTVRILGAGIPWGLLPVAAPAIARFF